jgi:hypothetical protein
MKRECYGLVNKRNGQLLVGQYVRYPTLYDTKAEAERARASCEKVVKVRIIYEVVD